LNISRPRILLYGNLPVDGGVPVHISHLADLLIQGGAEVWIASLGKDFFDARGDHLARLGAHLITTGFRSGAPGYGKQAEAILHWPRRLPFRGFDRLVIFGAGGFGGLMMLFKRPGGFAIYAEVGPGKRFPPGWRALPHEAMLGTVDGIACLSEPGVREFARNYNVKAPIRVLPHFTLADTPLPRSAATFEGQQTGVLRIAFFGRLEGYKQPDLLLEIWDDLNIGPARLTYYGTGTLEGKLSAMIAARVNPGSISMHGRYEQGDIGRLMSECDLVVLPSIDEGFGLVLLEAIAYGVPFVTTSDGGAVDLAAASPYLRAVLPNRDSIMGAVREIAAQLRGGQVDHASLQKLYRENYGYDAVASLWRRALADPMKFWGLRKDADVV
jgi:glycosyltransferase involved in cell wall biosynthesis